MANLVGKIEVHQSWPDNYEMWSVCVHDGVQWLRLRDDLDVVDAHDMATRLRGIFHNERQD